MLKTLVEKVCVEVLLIEVAEKMNLNLLVKSDKLKYNFDDEYYIEYSEHFV